MNKTLLTAGIALALGVVWTAGPALAQQTTSEKAESKTERAKDKAVEAKDTVKEKAVEAKDTVKEKARDAKEKIKEKTTELKDKVKAKTGRMEAKAEHKDVMAMQQALKDKGHDPGPIDGMMGPRTKTALREYQKKEGLKATGRWDDETAAKLGVRMSAADKETVAPSASPAASPQPGASTPPAATPEDKTSPPSKRENP